MTANIYLGDNQAAFDSGKKWSLAIVDPPYGINVGRMNMGMGTGKRCAKKKNRKWAAADRDSSVPDESYFLALKAVSTNQIIWGGNYFDCLPIFNPKAQRLEDFRQLDGIVWDKGEGMYGRDFSEAEIAYSTCGSGWFKQQPVQHGRIHPTSKPKELYRYVLKTFAKPGQSILDTHGGGMNIVLACIDLGFDIDIWEKDPDYFASAKLRIQNYCKQLPLFGEPPVINFYE